MHARTLWLGALMMLGAGASPRNVSFSAVDSDSCAMPRGVRTTGTCSRKARAKHASYLSTEEAYKELFGRLNAAIDGIERDDPAWFGAAMEGVSLQSFRHAEGERVHYHAEPLAGAVYDPSMPWRNVDGWVDAATTLIARKDSFLVIVADLLLTRAPIANAFVARGGFDAHSVDAYDLDSAPLNFFAFWEYVGDMRVWQLARQTRRVALGAPVRTLLPSPWRESVLLRQFELIKSHQQGKGIGWPNIERTSKPIEDELSAVADAFLESARAAAPPPTTPTLSPVDDLPTPAQVESGGGFTAVRRLVTGAIGHVVARTRERVLAERRARIARDVALARVRQKNASAFEKAEAARADRERRALEATAKALVASLLASGFAALATHAAKRHKAQAKAAERARAEARASERAKADAQRATERNRARLAAAAVAAKPTQEEPAAATPLPPKKRAQKRRPKRGAAPAAAVAAPAAVPSAPPPDPQPPEPPSPPPFDALEIDAAIARSLQEDDPSPPLPSATDTPVVPVVPGTLTEPDDDDLCVICFEAQRGVVALECFHFAVCADCAAPLAACPMCRTPTSFRALFKA